MDQAANIALSGLHAASLRLYAAASNIVNGEVNAYQPVTVAQSPGPGGGVTASQRPVTPLLAYDPAAPFANLQANLDRPAQLVDLKLAEHDFRASLLAYKASAEMFKSLLDATDQVSRQS